MQSLKKLPMAIAIACFFAGAVSADAAEITQLCQAPAGPAVKGGSKFTADQRAEIQARMELAN